MASCKNLYFFLYIQKTDKKEKAFQAFKADCFLVTFVLLQ